MLYGTVEPEEEPLIEGMCNGWLKGSDWSKPMFNSKIEPFDNLTALMYHLDTLVEGIDLVEMCGDEGRVSTLAVRRHLGVGENFDLVTSRNLNDPHDQDLVRTYFRKYRPLVVIMGPTCKPCLLYTSPSPRD